MPYPTSFIFVPGSWHRPETWDKVSTKIEMEGYRCISVALPSTLSDPAATFGNDVRAVQDAIASQISEGRNVVLVVHSYGGQVGNSAVKGFVRGAQMAGSDTTGHVIGLAMMATGFTVTGLSFIDGVGGKPPPQWTANTETGFAEIVVDAREMLYHDLPEEEGVAWVNKLTKQSLKSLMAGGEYAYSGWQDVPCWYLATMDDKALPSQAQQFFVKMAQDAGADVTMREVTSSHSPMLSKSQETADFILEAANYFTGKQ